MFWRILSTLFHWVKSNFRNTNELQHKFLVVKCICFIPVSPCVCRCVIFVYHCSVLEILSESCEGESCWLYTVKLKQKSGLFALSIHLLCYLCCVAGLLVKVHNSHIWVFGSLVLYFMIYMKIFAHTNLCSQMHFSWNVKIQLKWIWSVKHKAQAASSHQREKLTITLQEYRQNGKDLGIYW